MKKTKRHVLPRGIKVRTLLFPVIIIITFIPKQANPVLAKGINESIQQDKQTISFDKFVSLFPATFPKEIYLSHPPNGKKVLQPTDNYLDYYQLQLPNGQIISDISGYAQSYRRVSKDVYWFGVIAYGSYGGDTGYYLHVINKTTGKRLGPFVLSSVFGDEGYLDYTNGVFLNDTVYSFQRFWNNENFKTDSSSGTFRIE